MSRQICVVLLMLAVLQSCAPESSQQQSTREELPLHLFLLAGQSNMAGRGVLDESSKTPHPRVLVLTKEGEWAPAVDPLHYDKPIAGVGPGKAFGEAIAERNPEIRVGLIPAAVGGSPISSWKPGALDAATNTHPYDDALQRARRAVQDGELKAILWHQGESDSNETLAPIYKQNLKDFIDQIRNDLGMPNLPVIIGQLGQFSEKPWDSWRAMVNQVHEEVAHEIPEAAFVSSEGLSHKGDTLHFSTEAARILGRRYAAAYEKWEPLE